MSHREFMIVLAHTHVCGSCRQRLLDDPIASVRGRSLTEQEHEALGGLKFEHYVTPDTLARAAGVTVAAADEFRVVASQ